MRVAPLTQRLGWLLASALVVAVANPPAARAQDPSSAEDRAATLARQGLDLFNQGRFDDALKAFEEANDAAASPVFGLYIARCLRNSGKLVRSRQRYREVAQTDLNDNAPAPFRSAQTDAKRELEQIEPRIPRVVFALSRGGPEIVLSVDGQTVQPEVPLEFDPGKHEVVAREGDLELARQSIDLAEGDKLARIAVALKETGSETERPASRGSLLPGIVVLSAGGLGLLIGGITGGLALSQKGDLDPVCPAGACPPERADDLDQANALATASTVSFIIGGAAAAAGVVLLIVQPEIGGDDPPAPQLSLRTRGAGLEFRATF